MERKKTAMHPNLCSTEFRPVVLRLNRSYYVLPLLMLPIFQVMLHAFINLEPGPQRNQEIDPFERSVSFAVLISVPVFFNLLCVYLLLAYLRVRITIDSTHLISQGVFLRREIALHEITQVIWPTAERRPPILVIQGPQSRIKIAFYELKESPSDRCEQQIRDALPHKVQIGWQEFEKKQIAPPRRAPRFRWLALVNAFLYMLVPGLCILLWARIAPEVPGVTLFAPSEIVAERQVLIQTAAIFIAVCAVCIALAAFYLYRYITFRETPSTSK
jgi:hypothetical protein